MLKGFFWLLTCGILKLALATELAPNTEVLDVIRFMDEAGEAVKDDYVFDIEGMSLEEIISYHEGEAPWLKENQEIKFDFDNLEEDLVQIDFLATDRKKEDRIIGEIIRRGDKVVEIPYEFSEERLLYIAEGVLKHTGMDCSAFRRFRQRYRGMDSVKQILIPYNYGYLSLTQYLLNRVTMSDRFAFVLIKQCDSVELLYPFENQLRNLINLYTTVEPLLIHAVRYNRMRIAEFFIKKLGANIHMRTLPAEGIESCLHVLNSNSPVWLLNLLLENGADPLAPNSRDESILLTWVRNDVSLILFERLQTVIGNEAMLRLANARSIFREYPLTLALTRKKYRILRFLLHLGANVNVIVPAGYAADPFEHYLQAISVLIMGSRNFNNRPPLNWAVIKRDFLALRILLKEAKMDFTATDDFGENSLIEAVREQDYDSVKLIVESGRLDPCKAGSNFGESAFELAQRFEYTEIVELLRPYCLVNRVDEEVELITFNERK